MLLVLLFFVFAKIPSAIYKKFSPQMLMHFNRWLIIKYHSSIIKKYLAEYALRFAAGFKKD
jgi:hypothetical protein